MNRKLSSGDIVYRNQRIHRLLGRRFMLSLWIVLLLLWCVLIRQSFTAMPLDEITLGGVQLHEWKRPFAFAGMTVGMIGCVLCLGSLFWFLLSFLTGADWNIRLRRVFAATSWGFLPGVLILVGTVGCLMPIIFPKVAVYWGGDGVGTGVQAFGVLSFADWTWWNPAWLYVRMGGLVLIAWCMVQSWGTLSAKETIWKPACYRVGSGLCLLLTVLLLGMLGMDIPGGIIGRGVLSMFPAYMVAYSLLASLAFVVFASVGVLRLNGGKSLPWNRLGGMLIAMVLIKAYLAYSQYMIPWYAELPSEVSLWHGICCSNWYGVLMVAFILQFLVPFLVLLFPALRRRPSVLVAVCISILLGILSEACCMCSSIVGDGLTSWSVWIPLLLLLAVLSIICCCSFLGTLSAFKAFPES